MAAGWSLINVLMLTQLIYWWTLLKYMSVPASSNICLYPQQLLTHPQQLNSKPQNHYWTTGELEHRNSIGP